MTEAERLAAAYLAARGAWRRAKRAKQPTDEAWRAWQAAEDELIGLLQSSSGDGEPFGAIVAGSEALVVDCLGTIEHHPIVGRVAETDQ